MEHASQPEFVTTAAHESPESVLPSPPVRRTRWLAWVLGAVALASVAIVAVFFLTRPKGQAMHGEPSDKQSSAGLPVNTVVPVQKTLQRQLEQPGSIRAEAQAELCTKTSGWVKFIQRELNSVAVAEIITQGLSLASMGPIGSPGGDLALLTIGASRAVGDAPQKDIGARVRAGEIILQLENPELAQDVSQKEALYEQARAELKQARTAIGTYEAAVGAAVSQQRQVEAEIRRYASEHAFQAMQLKRTEDLLRDRVGTQEVVDEKKNQVNAALAAWESSQAKAQTAKADFAVVSSKLAAARDDLLVKEARVRVALEDLRRAELLSDYANVRAPFDGVITYRGVDEGDFVQNSSTGAARHVITVAAIDRVKVVLQVPEREAPFVRVGAPAIVHMDARDGWETHGYVSRSSQSLDAASRTMQIEIDLDNKDRHLLPGMYGQVTVILQSIADARAIPASAVHSRRGENFIYVVKDGVAQRQKVKIRYDDGRELEVVKLLGDREIPLDGTEELIVSNKGEIAEGQRVRATRMTVGSAK